MTLGLGRGRKVLQRVHCCTNVYCCVVCVLLYVCITAWGLSATCMCVLPSGCLCLRFACWYPTSPSPQGRDPGGPTLSPVKGRPCGLPIAADVNIPSPLLQTLAPQVCSHIALHWSLGGPPPSLPGCQYPPGAANATGGSAMDAAAADTVHIALVTDLDGWAANHVLSAVLVC